VKLWKAILGTEFKVSDHGDIKRGDKIITPILSKRNLRFVDIGPKRYLVHRIVAMAFLQKPLGHTIVCFKDGDKSNMHVSNLEWKTMSEVVRKARENSGAIKIRPEMVPAIKQDKRSHKKIAKEYGVSSNAIRAIQEEKAWSWLK